MSNQADLDALYASLDDDPNPVIANLRQSAKQLVPGDGSLRPRIILVGEAPGATEDATGTPFVGRSGRLLDELLGVAHLKREEVWITNVVKYRPAGNRTPDAAEVAAFLPYLRREVALVGGASCCMLVGLGRTACCAMSGETISVANRAGSWVLLKGGWRMFVSCHPSWGLRNPGNRGKMVRDFDVLRKTMLK